MRRKNSVGSGAKAICRTQSPDLTRFLRRLCALLDGVGPPTLPLPCHWRKRYLLLLSSHTV